MLEMAGVFGDKRLCLATVAQREPPGEAAGDQWNEHEQKVVDFHHR
jgi:hypothetical protein